MPIHITPLNDLYRHTSTDAAAAVLRCAGKRLQSGWVQHEATAESCPCLPKIFYLDDEGEYLDAPLVVHNSWDHRELFEESNEPCPYVARH